MKRRALVTGAAAGLAAGVAAALPADGFERVAITYRTTFPAQTLAAIESAGAFAGAARVDFLHDEATVSGALEKLVHDCGPFDTLVHGVGPMVVKRFERMTMDDYREMFDGNVRSAVLAARAVLPAMRSAQFGRIVFFGMNGSSETHRFAASRCIRRRRVPSWRSRAAWPSKKPSHNYGERHRARPHST